MKKFLCLVLAVIMLFGIVNVSVSAASASDLRFTLSIDGDSYYVGGYYNNLQGNLVIPATYKGKPVTQVGGFCNCKNLSSVTIPDSVTVIERDAFLYCTALTSVTMSNSITTIGLAAFDGCSSLKNVYYSGSSADRNKITIVRGNEALLGATWHYAKTSKPATPKTSTINAIGGVQVSWNKISGAVKYNVYRRSAGQTSYTYLGTTTGNTYLDKTVKNGQYYCYTVRAFNADGGYSTYVYANTSTRKYVATPKLKSLTNDTNGLKLTWSAISGASYRVYRRGAGSTSWTYLGTTTNTTYTDTKATSGAYWRYTVRAVSGGYYSGFESGIYTMRLANPYSIKASQVQNGVNVTWAKINGATGYRVYRRGAGQTSWTYLGATTGNSFKDTKVSYGQYYRYTVRATRGNVYSWFYSSGVVIKKYPVNPSNQKYWVIFTEGYRNDRVEMSTIDSTVPLKDLYIVWDTSLRINNSSKSGKCKQYYLDEKGEWVYIGEYGRLTDKATNIIASNLDIYDAHGNLIVKKSSYNSVNWNIVNSYR